MKGREADGDGAGRDLLAISASSELNTGLGWAFLRDLNRSFMSRTPFIGQCACAAAMLRFDPSGWDYCYKVRTSGPSTLSSLSRFDVLCELTTSFSCPTGI